MVVLATAGTLAGVAAASASAPSHHRVATTPIDHQLCYNASGSGWSVPGPVSLKNQFVSTPFPVTIGHVAYHCNPVVKILPSGQRYPINNPDAHLLCWTITASAQPAFNVQVANQFGTAVLHTGQPNLLCLPSWKSLTGPPNRTPSFPPGLSHFTCYPVTVVSGGYHPPAVMLQDQFAHAPVPATVNPVPQELCLPTEKHVGSMVYPIVDPTWHLLCFPVTPTPIITPVFDQNQFAPRPPGGFPVTIGQTKWLCPPSTKTIVWR